MPIYDLTYRGWKGEQTRIPAFFPILENTVKLAFRNKLLLTLYRACAIPTLIAGIYLYIRYQAEQFAGERAGLAWAFDMPQYLKFLSAQGIIAITVAGLVGSQAIAGDRRGNALESIFSRAIERRDYLWGRFLGLFSLVMGATLLPGFAIWLCDNAFSLDSQRLVKTLHYPIRITAWAIMVSASASLLILAFSALIRRGWLAIASFAAYLMLSVFITTAIAEVLARKFNEAANFVEGFSYFHALFAIQRDIFGVEPRVARIYTSTTSSVILLVSVALLSIFILMRRVRPIEVVS